MNDTLALGGWNIHSIHQFDIQLLLTINMLQYKPENLHQIYIDYRINILDRNIFCDKSESWKNKIEAVIFDNNQGIL